MSLISAWWVGKEKGNVIAVFMNKYLLVDMNKKEMLFWVIIKVNSISPLFRQN